MDSSGSDYLVCREQVSCCIIDPDMLDAVEDTRNDWFPPTAAEEEDRDMAWTDEDWKTREDSTWQLLGSWQLEHVGAWEETTSSWDQNDWWSSDDGDCGCGQSNTESEDAKTQLVTTTCENDEKPDNKQDKENALRNVLDDDELKLWPVKVAYQKTTHVFPVLKSEQLGTVIRCLAKWRGIQTQHLIMVKEWNTVYANDTLETIDWHPEDVLEVTYIGPVQVRTRHPRRLWRIAVESQMTENPVRINIKHSKNVVNLISEFALRVNLKMKPVKMMLKGQVLDPFSRLDAAGLKNGCTVEAVLEKEKDEVPCRSKCSARFALD